MKLTDLKKLKVSELRSRLTELGLDNKGLKAELLGRLWSALEAAQSGKHRDEEEVKLQNDRSLLTPPAPTETVEVFAPSLSPPTAAAVTEREYTDTSTQTDSDTGLPSLQQDAVCISSPQHGSESIPTLQHGPESIPTLQHGPESIPTLQHGPESISTLQHGPESISECVPEYQAEEGEVLMQQGGAEDPGEDRGEEEMGRGRAFYEFKEEIRYKRAKSPQPPVDREETDEQDEDKVRLDPYDRHLHFEVGPDGCACGQPRFWDRFPLLWSGCRLTHGVLQGRVGFEVRLERKLLTPQREEDYGLRVGWSVADSSLLLGEDKVSFAYDGRGKKVSGGKEEEFGEPFSEGDIIGCYVSFSADGAVELSFHKNGRVMGEAFSLDASVLRGRPLFPHVLCKNCSVRVLLDPTAPPWYPGPPGFTPLAALPAGQRERTTPPPPTFRAQCEMLLMVGLPGSGKSRWARTHMKQHPEKRYRLLGTEELLACMMSGGQRDSRLQQASHCLTDLIKIAAQTPGNYILDQSNILFSARRHKLQLFAGFRRRVVVVFPSADEWKRRLSLHQTSDGEQIPETALLKLQVSCSLPEQQSDLLEELQYVELPQERAQTLLQEYKAEARRLLPPIPKQEKKKPRLHKKRPHPHGAPPSHRIQWSGHNGWNGTRFNTQPWRQQPRYWSVPHQDLQDYYYRDVCYSGYEGYC